MFESSTILVRRYVWLRQKTHTRYDAATIKQLRKQQHSRHSGLQLAALADEGGASTMRILPFEWTAHIHLEITLMVLSGDLTSEGVLRL